MSEIRRLTEGSDAIELAFVERERTPVEAMKLGIQMHLGGLSLSDTVSILEGYGVSRSRKAVHDWVTKADLQPTAGRAPNQVALDETVIRVNDHQYWLYAAIDPDTNQYLHVRLFPTYNSEPILIYSAVTAETNRQIIQKVTILWRTSSALSTRSGSNGIDLLAGQGPSMTAYRNRSGGKRMPLVATRQPQKRTVVVLTVPTGIQYVTIREDFQDLECDLSLFDIKIDGVPIWERLRTNIFREIREQSGVNQAHTKTDLNFINNIKLLIQWGRNFFYRNPFLATKSDIIFIGHQRRKKQSDEYWWDIYCDPIHEYCSLDSVHFERPYLLGHRSPAKTDSLRYLDLIEISGGIQCKLGFHEISLSTDERTRLREIEEEIEDRFDANVSITNQVHILLRNRRSRLWLYKKLLKRVDPELVVLVVSYTKETFIEACKEQGIPVVELQHGVIYDAHFGYSYRGDRTKKMFPDYFLTWGDFWTNCVEFPIPDDRILSVGYPYLEQSVEQYTDVESNDQLVFISQGTIGEQLSKFALEVARHPEMDHDVIYKLHPGEYDRWKDMYPWLADADFEIVDDSDRKMYQLFAESNAQVGVGSTALYEGLCFDLETYVYDCQGSRILQPLINEGAACRVSSADELAASLGQGPKAFNREYYFATDATKGMCETLKRLQRTGTVLERSKI